MMNKLRQALRSYLPPLQGHRKQFTNKDCKRGEGPTDCPTTYSVSDILQYGTPTRSNLHHSRDHVYAMSHGSPLWLCHYQPRLTNNKDQIAPSLKTPQFSKTVPQFSLLSDLTLHNHSIVPDIAFYLAWNSVSQSTECDVYSVSQSTECDVYSVSQSTECDVYSISGPLYLPNAARKVVYPIVDNVHIPTHFFKVYLTVHPCGHTNREAHVLQNDVRCSEAVVMQWWEIERAAGFHLFDKAVLMKVKAFG